MVGLAGTDFMDSAGQVTLVLEVTSMDHILKPHAIVEECLP
jgi:hypothetical protein